MDPIIKAALKSITGRVNLSALHPMDEDLIVATFKNLHKQGFTWDVDEIEQVARTMKCDKSPLKFLCKVAQEIQQGKNKRIKYPTTKAISINELKKRAKEEGYS